MLLMRIVGVTKVVIDFDSLDDTGDGFRSEGGNSRGHHGMTSAATDVLPQVIVQGTYAVCRC